MRVTILDLFPLPSFVRQHIGGYLPLPGIEQQPFGMFDRHGVVAMLAEHQQVVGGRDGTAGGIVHDGLVGEVFRHRPVADP